MKIENLNLQLISYYTDAKDFNQFSINMFIFFKKVFFLSRLHTHLKNMYYSDYHLTSISRVDYILTPICRYALTLVQCSDIP